MEDRPEPTNISSRLSRKVFVAKEEWPKCEVKRRDNPGEKRRKSGSPREKEKVRGRSLQIRLDPLLKRRK